MTAWLALDLMDESDMEDAKQRLESAQQTGIDTLVWNIGGTQTNNFPEQNRGVIDFLTGSKKGYKSSKESKQQYISRMIKKGECTKTRNSEVYLTLGEIVLELKVTNSNTFQAQQNMSFYNVDQDSFLGGIIVDLQDVKGEVTVRTHVVNLEYVRWHTTDKKAYEPTARIEKPDRIKYRPY
ncbi:hypothetical protein HN587_03750 [Candidatus Woesearchaeota archaeon]|jgi:hypothetical protein|nr:hypothetical protein [Candidatus Woesearchaeota archaeon]